MAIKIREIFKLEKLWQTIFLLFLFLLPWQTRWVFSKGFTTGEMVEFWSFSLYATDIILICAILALLAFFNFKKTEKMPALFPILLVTFLAVCFFSLYSAVDKKIVIYSLCQIIKGVIILLLAAKTDIDKIKIHWAILLSGALQAILAIVQFFMQRIPEISWLGLFKRVPSDLGVSVVESGERVLRAYGAFNSPNILAGFLVVCILLGAILYLTPFLPLSLVRRGGRGGEVMVLALISLCSVGLFFTFSRAAWLALLIALAVSSIYQACRKNFATLKIFILIIVIFGVLGGVYHNLILTRLEANERLESQSIEERIDQFQYFKILIKDNWQMGQGLGNYTRAIYEKINIDLEAYQYQPIHNVYLLALAELGAIGFAIFLLLLAYLVKASIKNPNYLALILAILTIFAFDHYFWSQSFGIVIFWLILAIIIKNPVEKIKA